MYIPFVYGFDSLFTPFVGASSEYLSKINAYLSVYGSSSLVVGYLADLSAEELYIALTQHELNMASVSNENAAILLDIASKRYVDSIDRAAHEFVRNAKISGANSQSAIMDAKIAAIDADRAALVTLQVEVDLAIDRQELRVKELTAKISIQSVEMAMVEAEVLQKELDVAKAQLEELRTYQRVIEYQIQVTEASVEIQRVPAEIAQLRADRAEYVVRKANLEVQKIELDAQTATLKSEVEGVSVKIKLSEADKVDSQYREAAVGTHILELQSQYNALSAQIEATRAKSQEIDAQIAATSARISASSAKIAEADYEIAKVGVDADSAYAQAKQHLLSSTSVDEASALRAKASKELSVWPEKIGALNSRRDMLIKEADLYNGDIRASTKSSFDARQSMGASRTSAEIARIQAEVDTAYAHSDAQVSMATVRQNVADREFDIESEITGYSVQMFSKESTGQSELSAANIDAHKTIATSNVYSNVSHLIGGK